MWNAFLWISSIVQLFDFLTSDVLPEKLHKEVAYEIAHKGKV